MGPEVEDVEVRCDKREELGLETVLDGVELAQEGEKVREGVAVERESLES